MQRFDSMSKFLSSNKHYNFLGVQKIVRYILHYHISTTSRWRSLWRRFRQCFQRKILHVYNENVSDCKHSLLKNEKYAVSYRNLLNTKCICVLHKGVKKGIKNLKKRTFTLIHGYFENKSKLSYSMVVFVLALPQNIFKPHYYVFVKTFDQTRSSCHHDLQLVPWESQSDESHDQN